MMGKINIVFVVLLAKFCHVQVTGSNRHSEHTESERFMFYYAGGIFIGSNRLTCILVPLNKQEIDEVHTTNGIGEIELKMMKEWMGFLPEVQILSSNPIVSPQILHWCNSRELILLLRNNSGSTNPPNQITTNSYTFLGSGSTSTTPSGKVPLSNALPTTDENTETPIKTSVRNQVTSFATQPPVNHTTTKELQVSATSQHARQTTPASVFGAFVIYEKLSNGSMRAVIVEDDVCYIYKMTDTEEQLVHMGSDIRDAFERVLLSKDRSHVIRNDMYIKGANALVTQECHGSVFEFM